MEVQQLLLDEVLNFVDSYARKAVVTIDGVKKEYEVHRTDIKGNQLKKMVFIENEIGTITNAILVDSQGRNLFVKDMNILKKEDGFMIVFKLDIKIEGVVS